MMLILHVTERRVLEPLYCICSIHGSISLLKGDIQFKNTGCFLLGYSISAKNVEASGIRQSHWPLCFCLLKYLKLSLMYSM